MVFSPQGRVPKKFLFKIKGQDMKIVHKFCYLGITGGLIPLHKETFTRLRRPKLYFRSKYDENVCPAP